MPLSTAWFVHEDRDTSWFFAIYVLLGNMCAGISWGDGLEDGAGGRWVCRFPY